MADDMNTVPPRCVSTAEGRTFRFSAYDNGCLFIAHHQDADLWAMLSPSDVDALVEAVIAARLSVLISD
jgi:hypothetical protein